MKNLFLSTACLLAAFSAPGQTIEFLPNNTVRGLDKTLILNGIAGQFTPAKKLRLHNRTRETLEIHIRPTVESNVLYFTGGSKNDRSYFLHLAPGRIDNLQVYGFVNSPVIRSYAGQLAVTATPVLPGNKRGESRTMELPVLLYFTAAPAKPAARARTAPESPSTASKAKAEPKPAPAVARRWTKPDRYEVMMRSGLPVRWHLKRLPLKVYSDHSHTGDSSTQYQVVTLRAIQVWNNAARENGLGRDFFKLVQKPKQADIRIDWTGTRLLPGAQGTAYPSSGLIGMLPLSRYKGLGRAGGALMQELCHMLGVAHSEEAADIMYERMQKSNPDLWQLNVTARDRQMLGWLYSQTRYAALRD